MDLHYHNYHNKLCLNLSFSSFALGLPIQVRDQALRIKDEMPKSDVNKEFYTQNMEKEVSIALIFDLLPI